MGQLYLERHSHRERGEAFEFTQGQAKAQGGQPNPSLLFRVYADRLVLVYEYAYISRLHIIR